MEPWVVVNTHPHKEVYAIENLRRQDLDVYCPMLKQRIKHARRITEVLRPLFPSYMFVKINPDYRQWKPILSTFGVRTLVCCGEQPSLLDDDFISALKAREEGGVIVPQSSKFRVGQQVRIEEGAFDGVVATIIDLSEKDRLVVLVNLLQKDVRMKLNTLSVTAA
jgi:transcriptional antiterminator RfaH